MLLLKKPPRQLREDGWSGSPPRAASTRGRSRDNGVDEAQQPVAVARCGDTRKCQNVYWLENRRGIEVPEVMVFGAAGVRERFEVGGIGGDVGGAGKRSPRATGMARGC